MRKFDLKLRSKRFYLVKSQKKNVFAYFVGRLLFQGKRVRAIKYFTNALGEVKIRTKKNPVNIFFKAVNNVKPLLVIRSKVIAGKTYQLPFPATHDKDYKLAARWMVDSARFQWARGLSSKLSLEIIEAAENKGWAVRKRNDQHKILVGNRAFINYL